MPRRNKHSITMHQNHWYTAGASSKIQLELLQRSQRHLNLIEIWSEPIFGIFLDRRWEKDRFPLNNNNTICHMSIAGFRGWCEGSASYKFCEIVSF